MGLGVGSRKSWTDKSSKCCMIGVLVPAHIVEVVAVVDVLVVTMEERGCRHFYSAR